MKLSLDRLMEQNEFWVMVFIIVVLILNWPLLTIAGDFSVLGFPVKLIYLTAAWLLIVYIGYRFDKGGKA